MPCQHVRVLSKPQLWERQHAAVAAVAPVAAARLCQSGQLACSATNPQQGILAVVSSSLPRIQRRVGHKPLQTFRQAQQQQVTRRSSSSSKQVLSSLCNRCRMISRHASRCAKHHHLQRVHSRCRSNCLCSKRSSRTSSHSSGRSSSRQHW